MTSVPYLSCINFQLQLPDLKNLAVYSRIFLGELLEQSPLSSVRPWTYPVSELYHLSISLHIAAILISCSDKATTVEVFSRETLTSSVAAFMTSPAGLEEHLQSSRKFKGNKTLALTCSVCSMCLDQSPLDRHLLNDPGRKIYDMYDCPEIYSNPGRTNEFHYRNS